MKETNDYGTGIPLHEMEALARVLLPEIQKFFESEEGQMEFQAWKERQKKEIQSCQWFEGRNKRFIHAIHNQTH